MADVQHSNLAGLDLHQDLRIKQPVRAASTANIASLSAPGSAIDGVTLVSGDRILLKDQSTASQNGLYVWTGASAALTRTTDAAAATDFGYGFLVYVREGTANGGKNWQYTTSTTPVVVGTTALAFAQVGTAFPNQTANTVFAGPTTGGAAAPAFRAVVAADLPVFVASGASHAVGAVPDPGASAGTTKFLREDATFAVPPGTAAASPLAASARLRLSGNQSIATATATAIKWDTEDTDSDNQHYTSAANLTGTVAKAGTTTLTGTSTLFTTELSVGQVISVPGTSTEVRVVTAIASDTSLTVNTAFVNTASGQTATRVNSALVFRTAGFYWVESGILAATAIWTIQIRLNGTTIIGEYIMTATGTSGQVFAAQQFAQWDYVEVIVTQPSGGSVNVTADQRTYLADGVSGYVAAPYIKVQDQKANPSDGGTFTSGAWQKRDLNTIVNDAAGLVSLASNQITLPAGKYWVSITAPVYEVQLHQLRLQNVTDAVTLVLGQTAWAGSNPAISDSHATCVGQFTLSGTKTLEVQHYCQTTKASVGFGVGPSGSLAGAFAGGPDVYTVAEFRKEG